MRAILRGIRSTLKAAFLLVLATGSVLAFRALDGHGESVCYGDTNMGRLENSRRLPLSGENFSAYWSVGWLLGRANMHGTPRDIVAGAYQSLAESNSDLTFVYGEAGWPWGGWFWPHRTHQNGLSVDFVVPVRDAAGLSVPFPRTMLTGGFYAVDVGADGGFGEYRVDFDAMAAQLTALRVAAAKKNVRIRRVFFDPGLQPHLFAAPAGADLSSQISFSQNRSWFRHDAHYHVDFDVPCRPLG